MLKPAHVGHLAQLRALIREGARDGSFDQELAADTPESEEFFAKLKRALVTGYFVETNARTGRIDTVSVPGYVFWPDEGQTGTGPEGFGLFRSLEEGGYELWLAGLEFARRGDGHGSQLLTALFATPPGQKTFVVRVQRTSRYVNAVSHLLGKFGFLPIGDTKARRWFVRTDAPAALVDRLRSATSPLPSAH
jgi:hypothetical protein